MALCQPLSGAFVDNERSKASGDTGPTRALGSMASGLGKVDRLEVAPALPSQSWVAFRCCGHTESGDQSWDAV